MTMASAATSASSAAHTFAGAASPAASGAGWFENGSLTFELVKGLPTTLVAVFVAYVAWRQYQVASEQRRVARAKLNLDLFDRRLRIFRATELFLFESLPGVIPSPKDGQTFIELFAEASFLFEVEVEAYMRRVMNLRADVAMIRRMNDAQSTAGKPQLIEQEAEAVRSITVEYADGCRTVFAPYLDFSEWR